MRELSIFVDESGSDGLADPDYILTIVFHDQTNTLDRSIHLYERSLEQKNLPDIPMHTSPLMNRKGDYRFLDLTTRKKILSTFRVFFRHTPIKYYSFSFKTKQFNDLEDLSNAMKRELVNIAFDNLSTLQSYDSIKVYYDNGQKSIANCLHSTIEFVLSRGVVVYRLASPAEYRLSQIADYICAIELIAIKYAESRQSSTEEKFFGTKSDFKKGVFKEVRKKAIKSYNRL